MFVAKNSAGQLTTLRSHDDGRRAAGQVYFCPACGGRVRLKNGAVMPAHFAHIGEPCPSHEPETAAHMAGKLWLAALGEKLGYQALLEVYYPVIDQRADVVWQDTTGQQKILELQCSPLSTLKLAARTAGYHQLGLPVTWIMGPPYATKQLTKRHEKFLTRTAQHGWHLWWWAEQRLTRWQFTPSGRLITTVTLQRQWTRQVSALIAPRKEAETLLNRAYYREPEFMQLAGRAYEQRHTLTGAPWVIHERPSGLPALPQPEWFLRLAWCVAFGDQPNIKKAAEAAFWQRYVTPERTPLGDHAALISAVRAHWLLVLETTGYLRVHAGGWEWARPLTWYPDLATKLAAWQES